MRIHIFIFWKIFADFALKLQTKGFSSTIILYIIRILESATKQECVTKQMHRFARGDCI